MRRTAVYKHPLFLAHYTGRDHLESASRLQALYRELERDGGELLFPTFAEASRSTIELNHAPKLIREVAATAARTASFLDADTRTSKDSFAAAQLAVGAVIDGLARMEAGEIDNVFCLVRPPGHHAEYDRAMGFCLFNNIAVAAHWALHRLGTRRIMIVDWDLHHGNGTQNSFYRSEKVLYCSTHQAPLYPGTGALTESGEGAGRGYTVNIPLLPGHGDREFARIFNEIVVPLARSYHPELVLVSCGFDCMAGDPVGSLRVTPAGIAYMARVAVEIAHEHCRGKVLFVLEGGYDRENMRQGALAVLRELHGAPLACDHSTWLTAKEHLRLQSSRAVSSCIDRAVDEVRNRGFC